MHYSPGGRAFHAYVLTGQQLGDYTYRGWRRETVAVYEGKVVGLPTHGLVVHLYYLRDLFSAAGLRPPRTWDEAIAIARRFNGTDLDGDGAANDYGMCMW
ncbi:hypothetical protein HYH02_010816 [Chlamydomonas schloesseri]|uniref:Extracellular solute-binding protein n=1 Tax=Chlamydomonas schloesseri TaxID=2026947 RepID=A0A835T6J5_9CHLO|nr:hypothetical protein HYH02_010816 [Chlamydomonas schloesseri]|eukprot:KAG2438361.1 hypothetical protein HYH02_010816 [Chlamydomonas schloesseri]